MIQLTPEARTIVQAQIPGTAPTIDVPYEVLRTLYPELFVYGPATAAFKAELSTIISVFSPYSGSIKQQNAKNHLVEATTTFEVAPPSDMTYYEDFKRECTMPMKLYEAQVDEDFPELTHTKNMLNMGEGRSYPGTMVLTHAGLSATFLINKLKYFIARDLLVCLTERMVDHDWDDLRTASTRFMLDYEQWKSVYVPPSESE